MMKFHEVCHLYISLCLTLLFHTMIDFTNLRFNNMRTFYLMQVYKLEYLFKILILFAGAIAGVFCFRLTFSPYAKDRNIACYMNYTMSMNVFASLCNLFVL